MATTDQVVTDCLNDYLLAGHRPTVDRLAEPLDGTETDVDLEFEVPAAKQQGARLSVDYEDMHVWSFSTPTATVQRGAYGTTAATHVDDSLVYVNARWPRSAVLRAVRDELRALSAEGLYQVARIELTQDPSQVGYDMTGLTEADVLGLVDVRMEDPNATSQRWTRVARGVELVRDMSTSDFASGMALMVPYAAGSGDAIQVRYKARFGAISDTTADLATETGLHTEAHDILAIGAAVRLMSGREVMRSDMRHQGDSRRPVEVPPGAITQSATGLRELRRERIAQEKRRLRAYYPPMVA